MRASSGAGNDVLFGRTSRFSVTGQADVFVFDDAHGINTIRDLTENVDQIAPSMHSAFGNFTDVSAALA